MCKSVKAIYFGNDNLHTAHEFFCCGLLQYILNCFCFSVWAGGDPHFRSLDGLDFTYNGRGEFLFSDVNNGQFVAHIRTSPVLGGKSSS